MATKVIELAGLSCLKTGADTEIAVTGYRPQIRFALSVNLSFGGWVKSFQAQVSGQILAGFINGY
ncbi:hypothetical protein QUA54_22130 [Microcoleus sp. MOSTC5]|uniref:hypothetical protein n=1 Tax=Microcoleus sp. MOSTC5 TaxID=3055378 RepID=UPI002FD167F3